MLTTQAAFLRCRDIRKYEGKAAGSLADLNESMKVPSGFGQRLDQVAAAVRLHDARVRPPFRIYVMGHTHAALLLEVVVKGRQRKDDLRNLMYEAFSAKLTPGNFDDKPGPHGGAPTFHYTAVQCDWEFTATGLASPAPDGWPGKGGHIKLEEPWGPKGEAVRECARYPIKYPGRPLLVFPMEKPKDTVLLSGGERPEDPMHVPPGAYIPRFYEGPPGGKRPFTWEGDVFYYRGLSVHAAGADFEPGQAVPVRWCFWDRAPEEGHQGKTWLAKQLVLSIWLKRRDGSWENVGQQPAIAQSEHDGGKSASSYAHGRTMLGKHEGKHKNPIKHLAHCLKEHGKYEVQRDPSIPGYVFPVCWLCLTARETPNDDELDLFTNPATSPLDLGTKTDSLKLQLFVKVKPVE